MANGTISGRRLVRRAIRASRVVGSLFVLAAHAAPRAAQADTHEEAIHLQYRATRGCPDPADFMARVHARSSRVRFARAGGENARTFEVQLDAGPPASGRVTIDDNGRSQGVRQVQAPTCAEVVDALALVVALAIEPSRDPTEDTASRAAPRAPMPSTPVAPPRAESQRDREAPRRSAFFAGADFIAAEGVAPRALLGASPFAGWRATGTSSEPSIRIAIERSTSGALAVPGGSAVFTWTVGRVDACLGAARGALRFDGCARVEAGALQVEGHGELAAQMQLVPWIAAGPVVRGEWSLMPALFLDFEGDVLVRATDDTFFFRPDIAVYDVPFLGLGAAAGIGARFL